MKISSAIDINSTPEVVFSWLKSPSKAMEWMKSVSKTEILHETPDMVGTSFREIVEDENGAIEMKGLITGYQPNKSISFHLDSKVNIVDVVYRLEEILQGVRLLENSNVQWKFPMNIISIFLGNKMRQSILAQLQDEFKRLKELCEAEASNLNNN